MRKKSAYRPKPVKIPSLPMLDIDRDGLSLQMYSCVTALQFATDPSAIDVCAARFTKAMVSLSESGFYPKWLASQFVTAIRILKRGATDFNNTGKFSFPQTVIDYLFGVARTVDENIDKINIRAFVEAKQTVRVMDLMCGVEIEA